MGRGGLPRHFGESEQRSTLGQLRGRRWTGLEAWHAGGGQEEARVNCTIIARVFDFVASACRGLAAFHSSRSFCTPRLARYLLDRSCMIFELNAT